MSKHTPGPWKVESSSKDGSRVTAIALVAWCGANSCFGVDGNQFISAKQARANARLIAAAPELLEALKALDSAFMSHTLWNGEPPVEIVQARAAIAKATGEQL